jgi:hypothetical protein
MFDLRVFYLRAHFQERNYRVNREVAVQRIAYDSLYLDSRETSCGDTHHYCHPNGTFNSAPYS